MTRAAAMSPMDEAAATGAVALQRCGACGAFQYPPRDVCRVCLSDEFRWDVSDSVAGDLLATTTVCHSIEPGTALPQPVGLVLLGPGMTALCFLAAPTPPGPVTVRARSDTAGRAVLTAC